MARAHGVFSIALLSSALAACGGDDGPSLGEMSLLTANRPAALLSVWGSSASDVWVTGGRTELTGGPTLLHYDGTSWSSVDVGQDSLDLWWVFGFAADDVYFSGDGGTILHYDGATFTEMETPAGAGTIFGMWGSSTEDLWAVGDAGSDGVLLWRWDGEVWEDVGGPGGTPAGTSAFKVSGRGADDVWIACTEGATLHYAGGDGVDYVPTGLEGASLFGVAATPEDVVAVGVGADGKGLILETTGDAWSPVEPIGAAPWRGVTGDGDKVVAVGEGGALAVREGGGGWSSVEQRLTVDNFHGAWIDPDGGFWGVGGTFENVDITTDGFLIYAGAATISEVGE